MQTKVHITLEIEETTILRQGPRILAVKRTYEQQKAQVSPAEARAFFRKLDEQGKCRIVNETDIRSDKIE